MTAPGSFDFSRAVREWCFVQLPLLDLGEFRTMARARGLTDMGLHARDPWETLDREELLLLSPMPDTACGITTSQVV